LPPNVIVPSVIVETRSPDRPSFRYSMPTEFPVGLAIMPGPRRYPRLVTIGDVVFGLIALALWAAVVWRAARSGPGGPLWWATGCVAVIVTLKTGLVADPFNLATGGVYLDVVLQHVLGVLAATLILRRLTREGAGPSARPVWTVGAVMVVVLVATWFLGPVYDIPATSDWVPEPVIRSPWIATHFVAMDLWQAAFSATFARTAVVVARMRVPGAARRCLQMLAAAATGLGVSALIGIVARVVAISAGTTPPSFYLVQNLVLACVFGLFALAVAIPGSATFWARRTARA
jgi:hypothetical protein